MVDGHQIWDLACQVLRLHMDINSYDTLIRGTFFVDIDAENRLVIGVRNEFVRQMLQVRYYRHLRRILDDVSSGKFTEMLFEVRPKPPELEEPKPLFGVYHDTPSQSSDGSSASRLHQIITPSKTRDLAGLPINSKMTFRRFIPSSNNRLTFEAACAVADRPGYNYNPFLVYGGVGLGKSHILQAIGNACLQVGMIVVYVTAEIFTNELVQAIRTNTTQRFRQRYRDVDVLLMDDMQFIIGKDATQEELFHTFEELHRFNKQIVFASDRHPREFTDVEARLKSRFEGGLVTDVQPLTYEARLAIVEMWTQESGVTITRPVQEMIAKKAHHNVRELEGMFNQILARTRFNKNPLSISMASETIDQFERPRQHLQKVSPMDILRVTADYFKLTVDDLTGTRRLAKINAARQIAIYLMREHTDHTLAQIGEIFGRTHTTVLHGYNKIVEELKISDDLKQQIARIKAGLAG